MGEILFFFDWDEKVQSSQGSTNLYKAEVVRQIKSMLTISGYSIGFYTCIKHHV